MTSSHTDSLAAVARLTVTAHGTRLGDHLLGDGSSVMIGSGNNCAIRLDDVNISSIHCIVRVDDGQIHIQDWCSKLGTFVNDTRVEEQETVVPDGSSIRVGRYQIRVELTAKGNAQRANAKAHAINHQTTDDALEPVLDERSVGAASAALLAADEDEQEEASEDPRYSPSDALDRSDEEYERGRRNEPRGRSSDIAACTSGDERRRAEALLLAGFDPETVGLLQAEVECLQSELSERDRQLAELKSALEKRPESPREVDSDRTEALVGRLEQLLQELETSDQRTRVLEELLRSEQEVTRAQQEEQTQVESWLKDIERRMMVREQEWQAERETLTHRAQQYKDERDETDRRLEVAEQSPHGVALQQNVVRELRAQVDSLQEQLEAANRARQALQLKLDDVRSKSPEEARREYIEEALREDRLKLAQEQAALSRERSQLAKRLAELEQESQKGRRTETDERFRAFRQTLKELHRQDQVRSPGIRRATLGTRIADLWRKLDGPTDTD